MGYPLTSTINGLATTDNSPVTLLSIAPSSQLSFDQLTIINEGAVSGFVIVNGQPIRLPAAPTGAVTSWTLRGITLTSDVQIQRDAKTGTNMSAVYAFAA